MPNPQDLLRAFDTYLLGDEAMDHTHRAFVVLCCDTNQSVGAEFAQKFQALFEHTQAHFSDEEARMQESQFSAYAEHRADHQRILGDMNRFNQRIQAGRASMAKAWLNEGLPTWFDVHAKTMDSALAAHLSSRSKAMG